MRISRNRLVHPRDPFGRVEPAVTQVDESTRGLRDRRRARISLVVDCGHVRRQAGRERKSLEGCARRVARVVALPLPGAKAEGPELVEPAVQDPEGRVVVARDDGQLMIRVKVTVVADRGFADCKLFYALTTELAFEYVIRLRGDIYVTNAHGERRAAAAWVGDKGRARRLVGARVTDAYELPVGVVVCVQDPKMDEPWCLVASEATVPTRVLIRYYGKRWGIEAGFRDIKDMRFGMGLSSMHVSRPDRRDRLLLISALAIAVLSLLGAAGERIGYDRWLKANTVKRRTHSLFRQGLMLYHHLPNWPEDRIRPLMETFGSMLMEQRVYREVFGVI